MYSAESRQLSVVRRIQHPFAIDGFRGLRAAGGAGARRRCFRGRCSGCRTAKYHACSQQHTGSTNNGVFHGCSLLCIDVQQRKPLSEHPSRFCSLKAGLHLLRGTRLSGISQPVFAFKISPKKMRLEPRSTTRKKGGATHVLGCTPKWSIRGSWNGTHDSPPSGAKLPHAGRPTPLCAFSASAAVQNLAQQRRLLCPASAEGQELDAYDTERTLSVGRTPRSVPLTTVSPPQRRQRYKTCPNTDACHPQRRRSPKSRPSNDACDPHT